MPTYEGSVRFLCFMHHVGVDFETTFTLANFEAD